jgi:hypothetical protein
MTGRGIFSLRVAVLARLQGGAIHNSRTEYSTVLPGPKGLQLCYSNLVAIYPEGGKKGRSKRMGEKEKKRGREPQVKLEP